MRLETTFMTWKRVDSCLMRIWFRRFGLNRARVASNAAKREAEWEVGWFLIFGFLSWCLPFLLLISRLT